METRIRSSVRYSRRRLLFLKAVSKDLGELGISSTVRRKKASILFSVGLEDFAPESTLAFIREKRRREINNGMAARRNSIAAESKSSEAIDPSRIEPHLTFCESKDDYETFQQLSSVHSLPLPKLLFRRVCGIVRDRGQKHNPAIGILALSSSVFSLAGRDAYFGWTASGDLSKKARGLASCMQLSICIAIPPYDSFRAARLIAALSASSESAAYFARRYDTADSPATLHAIVTTCASGVHSPIFNRIMVRPGGLYKRVGVTSGYSTHFYSGETVAAAKAIVKHRKPFLSTNGARTIQILKYGLNDCKVPREMLLRLGIRKGVYVAHGGQASLDFLRGVCDSAVPSWPSSAEIIAYWRARELPKALAVNSDSITGPYLRA